MHIYIFKFPTHEKKLNVTTIMCFYLIVLSMAGLIMMRQVIHLSTFQPPVHNASSDALWPVKDFYRR